jgi:hypothetical protein
VNWTRCLHANGMGGRASLAIVTAPAPADVRLILDGTVVRVRLDRKATLISLSWSLACARTARKVLLAVKNMGSESAEAWRSVLDDLIERGLRRPAFLIVDGDMIYAATRKTSQRAARRSFENGGGSSTGLSRTVWRKPAIGYLPSPSCHRANGDKHFLSGRAIIVPAWATSRRSAAHRLKALPGGLIQALPD